VQGVENATPFIGGIAKGFGLFPHSGQYLQYLTVVFFTSESQKG
jgi:hypothetical protein